MGANSTQALGILAFLLAATALTAGIAFGGGALLVLALALLTVSGVIFLRAKPWEHEG